MLAGVVVVAVQLLRGRLGFHPADGWVAAAELLLVAATGTAMGRRYRFRTEPGSDHDQDGDTPTPIQARSITGSSVRAHARAPIQARLDRAGLLLWAVFLTVRVGSAVVAAALGAHVLETTGAILVSFGTNRLVAMLVAQHRAGRIGPPGSTPASFPCPPRRPRCPGYRESRRERRRWCRHRDEGEFTWVPTGTVSPTWPPSSATASS